MRAALAVEASVCDAQTLHRPSTHQVLVHNLRSILRPHIAIPDRLGIHDHGRPVLALVEAPGLVNAHRGTQAGGLRQLLQLGVQFALAVACARRTRCSFGANIVADEDVTLKGWQTKILLDRLSSA
jgi:hypothetical protein